jgi:hypothetical protein
MTEEEKKKRALSREQLPKYFAQGVLFSIIYTVLFIVWVFLAAILVVVGFIIGLIIGFVLLFFIIGWLNAVLTDWIWNTPIRTDWQDLLAHGFILFFGLLFAHVLGTLINYALPGLATLVVLFVVYCFIDGFIAKSIAEYYEERVEEIL